MGSDTGTEYWIKRMIAGRDETAWSQVLGRYGPPLTERLARLNVPPADRAEVLQRAWIVVLEKIDTFEHRGPGSFLAWLRAVVSKCALAWRSETHKRNRRAEPGVELDSLAAPESGLSRQWAVTEVQVLVERELLELSVSGIFEPKTLLAFRRRMIDGRTTTEVADELKMNVGAVMKATSRVLVRLRKKLSWFEE